MKWSLTFAPFLIYLMGKGISKGNQTMTPSACNWLSVQNETRQGTTLRNSGYESGRSLPDLIFVLGWSDQNYDVRAYTRKAGFQVPILETAKNVKFALFALPCRTNIVISR